MKIRITDLLDEYMYDDIPLDPVGDGETKTKKHPGNPGHRRIGQMVAAAVIAVCVFVTGSIYFAGTGEETSLSDGSGTVVEEQSSWEETTEPEMSISPVPEPTPTIPPTATPTIQPSPEPSETPEGENGASPAPLPEVTPTPSPVVTPTPPPEVIPTPNPEDTTVWENTEVPDDNAWYSQVISIAPDGAYSTITEPDTGVIWGFGDFSFENDYVCFSLTYLDSGREPAVVGSEEQMRLGQVAEGEKQFFVIDGITTDGTAFAMANPELVDVNAEQGIYRYKARLLQPEVLNTIREFYLRKANGF